MHVSTVTIRALIAAMLVLFMGALHAEEAEPAFPAPANADAGQPLTADSVDRLLDSYTELTATFKNYESSGDAQALAEHVRAKDAHNKAKAIVTEHGFESWVDWYQQFLRAVRAYTNLKMKDEQAGQPQLEERIEQIRNNPDISDAQKEQMLEMLEASQGFVKAMTDANPEDIAAVKPHMARFEKVMNESGNK